MNGDTPQGDLPPELARLLPPEDPGAEVDARLASPVAAERVAGIDAALDAGLSSRLPALARLLDDDAPFIFEHGGGPFVGEVRFRALDAVEAFCGLLRQPFEWNPVTTARALPAAEATLRDPRLPRLQLDRRGRPLRHPDGSFVVGAPLGPGDAALDWPHAVAAFLPAPYAGVVEP